MASGGEVSPERVTEPLRGAGLQGRVGGRRGAARHVQQEQRHRGLGPRDPDVRRESLRPSGPSPPASPWSSSPSSQSSPRTSPWSPRVSARAQLPGGECRAAWRIRDSPRAVRLRPLRRVQQQTTAVQQRPPSATTTTTTLSPTAARGAEGAGA